LMSITRKVVYRQAEDGSIHENLSVFALVQDEDGIADLDELYILCDSAALYWHLGSDDWVELEKGGQTWVGSHTLSAGELGSLPRGAYRAVLLDKSGSRDERSFSVSTASKGRVFPRLRIAEGRYSVSSTYPKNTLLVYDKTGARIRSTVLSSKSGNLGGLKLPEAAFSLALWAEDEDSFSAALTQPVPLD